MDHAARDGRHHDRPAVPESRRQWNRGAHHQSEPDRVGPLAPGRGLRVPCAVHNLNPHRDRNRADGRRHGHFELRRLGDTGAEVRNALAALLSWSTTDKESIPKLAKGIVPAARSTAPCGRLSGPQLANAVPLEDARLSVTRVRVFFFVCFCSCFAFIVLQFFASLWLCLVCVGVC